MEGLYGTGTIGMEILQQLPDVDVVLIPKGSGGNCIANGSYFRQAKPDVKIIAVEPENSPALTTNLKTESGPSSSTLPRTLSCRASWADAPRIL